MNCTWCGKSMPSTSNWECRQYKGDCHKCYRNHECHKNNCPLREGWNLGDTLGGEEKDEKP